MEPSHPAISACLFDKTGMLLPGFTGNDVSIRRMVMTLQNRSGVESFADILPFLTITDQHYPIKLIVINKNPKNILVTNGIPINKLSADLVPTQYHSSITMAQAVQIIQMGESFYLYYKNLCVSNFMNELVSCLFPEYIIKDTYAAAVDSELMRKDVLETINSNSLSMVDHLILLMAKLHSGKIMSMEKIELVEELRYLMAFRCVDIADIHRMTGLVYNIMWYLSEADGKICMLSIRRLFEAYITWDAFAKSGTLPHNEIGGGLSGSYVDMIMQLFRFEDLVPVKASLLSDVGSKVRDVLRYLLKHKYVKADKSVEYKMLGADLSPIFAELAPYENMFGKIITDVCHAVQQRFEIWHSLYGKVNGDAFASLIFQSSLTSNQHGKYKTNGQNLGMRGGFVSVYNLCDKTKVVAQCFTHIRFGKNMRRKDLVWLDKAFPPASLTDAKHTVTRLSAIARIVLNGKYLKHVDELHLSKVGKEALILRARKTFVKVIRSFRIGTPMNVVIGVLLLALDDEPMVQRTIQRYIDMRVFMLSPNIMQGVFKSLSALYRKYGTNMDGDVLSDAVMCKIAYMELLFGRSEFISDVTAEIKNRTSGTVHLASVDGLQYRKEQINRIWHKGQGYDVSDEAFYDQLHSELWNICSKLVPKRATTTTYKSFLSKANTWLASGSAPGAKVTLPDCDAPISVGKRGWAEMTDMDKLSREIYTSKPVEFAVASEKYENGKGRALYGVEQKHYMHSTYATKGLEERLFLVPGLEKGVGGYNALAGDFHKANITGDPNTHCMMADYADFNIQHTPRAQAMLYEVLADIGHARGACIDWVQANRYIAKAKYNMWCRFSLTHANGGVTQRLLKVNQGMFSGTRSTDLLNTVLNLSYYNIAAKTADIIYGEQQSSQVHHVHQGDDVWISTAKPAWCAILYYVMNAMGLETQRSKQMFGAGRGEFLRVLYSKGIATGYLLRSVANMLLKEIQRPLVQDAVGMLRSLVDSLNTCSRRGLSSLAYCVLFDDFTDHYRRVNAFPGDPMPVTIPMSMVFAPVESGGVGLNKPQYGCVVIKQPMISHKAAISSSIFPSIKVNMPDIAQQLPDKCTQAWINSLYSYLSGTGYEMHLGLLHDQSVCSNFSDALYTGYKRRIHRKYKAECKVTVERFTSVKQKKDPVELPDNGKSDKSLMIYVNCPHVYDGNPHVVSSTASVPVSGMCISGKHTVYNDSVLNMINVKNTPITHILEQGYGKFTNNALSTKHDVRVPFHLSRLMISGTTNTMSSSLDTKHVNALKQAVVRSDLKSIPRLRSALDISEADAYILMFKAIIDLVDAGDMLVAKIQFFNKLLESRGLLPLRTALENVDIMLGGVDRFVQPSIIQSVQRVYVEDLFTAESDYPLLNDTSPCLNLCLQLRCMLSLRATQNLLHNDSLYKLSY